MNKSENRILEINNLINESSCPVKTKLYGGLPTGGGYKANTEFEIGAQRFSEAAHCILGSLGKIYGSGSNNPKRIERAHIEEELGIIEGVVKEYSRDLYSDRMYTTVEQAMKDGYTDEKYAKNAVEYVKKSIESIKSASPKLKSMAQNLIKQTDKDYPSEISELINATYGSIIILSNSMMKSVKNYPNKLTNPYKDVKLQNAVHRLSKAVKMVYK